MPFKPGQSGNPAGGHAGVSNNSKSGTQLREFMGRVLLKNRQRFVKGLHKLDEKEFMRAYIEMMHFVTPKPRSTELGNAITLDEFLSMPKEGRNKVIEDYKQQMQNKNGQEQPNQ
jgi:hypothetical protein